MAVKPYDTEPIPTLEASEPAMAYGSNEAILLHLEEEIMRQPLEIMEKLQDFLQDTIAAVKAKTKKKAKKEAMTWGEIADTLPVSPEIEALRGSFDINSFTREEIEADPKLEYLLRKHCGYEGKGFS